MDNSFLANSKLIVTFSNRRVCMVVKPRAPREFIAGFGLGVCDILSISFQLYQATVGGLPDRQFGMMEFADSDDPSASQVQVRVEVPTLIRQALARSLRETVEE